MESKPSPSLTFVLGEFEKVANDAIETTLKRSLSALDVSRLNQRLSILKLIFPEDGNNKMKRSAEVREHLIHHFIVRDFLLSLLSRRKKTTPARPTDVETQTTSMCI